MKKLMIALALAFAAVGGALVAPTLANTHAAACTSTSCGCSFAADRGFRLLPSEKIPKAAVQRARGRPQTRIPPDHSSHAVDVSAAREAGYAAVLRGICQRRNDEGFA